MCARACLSVSVSVSPSLRLSVPPSRSCIYVGWSAIVDVRALVPSRVRMGDFFSLSYFFILFVGDFFLHYFVLLS